MFTYVFVFYYVGRLWHYPWSAVYEVFSKPTTQSTPSKDNSISRQDKAIAIIYEDYNFLLHNVLSVNISRNTWLFY